MERIKFDHLLEIYRNTLFKRNSSEGELLIANSSILDLLNRLEHDTQASGDARIICSADASDLHVGDRVDVEIGSPRQALGVLASTFDEILVFPRALLQEPPNYFVKEDRTERHQVPPTELQTQYRQALKIVKLLAEAASFVDESKEELVFIADSRLVIPLDCKSTDLQILNSNQASKLLSNFDGDTHRDQKLGILQTSILSHLQPVPKAERLAFLLRNIEAVAEDVRNGYRLFASSFSYEKVRNEMANATVEFAGKIHKTFVDIQGQLLGIPAATFIVATQLKRADTCPVYWGNWAVIVGAWAFVALLVVSVVNQWLTLQTINSELKRQKSKIERDYAQLASDFTAPFAKLSARVCWHQFVLILIAGAAFTAAALAHYVSLWLDHVTPGQCV